MLVIGSWCMLKLYNCKLAQISKIYMLNVGLREVKQETTVLQII